MAVLLLGCYINIRGLPPYPEEKFMPSLMYAISKNDNIVVFSGAGASADSGIPTFRGDATSLWEGVLGPLILPFFGTPLGWRIAPRICWTLYDRFSRRKVYRAEPNRFHKLLGELHKQGKNVLVVTQNVDGLHQRGGVPRDKVVELHGTIWNCVCIKCHRTLSEINPVTFEAGTTPEDVPRCSCGGWPRPAAILFNDDYCPPDNYDMLKVVNSIMKNSTVIVCGLSGMVQSSDSAIRAAHHIVGRSNAYVINPRATKYSSELFKIRWIKGGASDVSQIISSFMEYEQNQK